MCIVIISPTPSSDSAIEWTQEIRRENKTSFLYYVVKLWQTYLGVEFLMDGKQKK